MRFTTTMRGQPVTVVYGTNPSGQVAGAWVELADSGPAELTDAEGDLVFEIASEQNKLAQQCRATQGAAA